MTPTWWSAHRWRGHAAVVAVLAALAVLLRPHGLAFPTLSGILMPVAASALIGTLVPVVVMSWLAPRAPAEAVAARDLRWRAAVIAGLVPLAVGLPSLLLGDAGVMTRTAIGMTGVALICRGRLRGTTAALPGMAYFIAAAMAGRDPQDRTTAASWAWVIDQSSSPTTWLAPLALWAAGLVVTLLHQEPPPAPD
ncbi:hypothetical protein [Parenemella sanctibonifatiensis]|uniref:hypothetical protein n=1 Tax=Parenemella sanctibonifatiensis TaxID=2016505 RepID=UPI000B96504B|nr:hypothetical protein [Parenemella sanctibonifatiensis]